MVLVLVGVLANIPGDLVVLIDVDQLLHERRRTFTVVSEQPRTHLSACMLLPVLLNYEGVRLGLLQPSLIELDVLSVDPVGLDVLRVA